MPSNSHDLKRLAHELIDRLTPSQATAIVGVLEAMVDPSSNGRLKGSVEGERQLRASGGTPSATREILVASVLAVFRENKDRLDPSKLVTMKWESPEIFWELLLLSFSTMGSSRGFKLMKEPTLHDAVTYGILETLAPRERLAALKRTLRAAQVRMPDRKAKWLIENFNRIHKDGGPEAVKSALNERLGRDEKIKFLCSFKGIGLKYARNMMMDTYHPEFRESIAIDERIKKIMAALNLGFGNDYVAAEEYFLGVAHDANITGWQLDRLLYNFTDDVLQSIKRSMNSAE
jgi:hypothetical protein